MARLVYLLATQQPVRRHELCRRFRVSRRTFARYIADVREAGFDVTYSDAEDCYRLNDANFAGPSH